MIQYLQSISNSMAERCGWYCHPCCRDKDEFNCSLDHHDPNLFDRSQVSPTIFCFDKILFVILLTRHIIILYSKQIYLSILVVSDRKSEHMVPNLSYLYGSAFHHYYLWSYGAWWHRGQMVYFYDGSWSLLSDMSLRP